MDNNSATRLGGLFRELQKRSTGRLRDDLVDRPMPPSAVTASGDAARCLDEFVLVERVGTSAVWQSWDRLLGRWVALKLRGEPDRAPQDHLVPLLRASESYVVMPWIDGVSLDRMKPTAKVAAEAVRIAGLTKGEHKLTPADVMLDRHGALWLLKAADPASLRDFARRLR